MRDVPARVSEATQGIEVLILVDHPVGVVDNALQNGNLVSAVIALGQIRQSHASPLVLFLDAEYRLVSLSRL